MPYFGKNPERGKGDGGKKYKFKKGVWNGKHSSTMAVSTMVYECLMAL